MPSHSTDEDFPEVPDFSDMMGEEETFQQKGAAAATGAASAPAPAPQEEEEEEEEDDEPKEPTQEQIDEWNQIRKLIEVPSGETFALDQEGRYVRKQGELMKKGAYVVDSGCSFV